jgi:hypothetical protein
MSLVLQGTSANSTSPITRTVSALTNNAGVAEVTTTAPHLFGNGDTVETYLNLAGFYASTWTITVIDSTHFLLNGSTYSATATGTVVDLSLTPQIKVPTDGDSGSMQLSGMLSALQGILDRTEYLQSEIVAANASVFALDLPARNWWLTQSAAALSLLGSPAVVVWDASAVTGANAAPFSWLMFAYNSGGGGTVVPISSDGTGDYTSYTGFSLTAPPIDATVDLASGIVMVATNVGGTTLSFASTAGTNLDTFGGGTSTGSQAVSGLSDVRVAAIAGKFILAAGSSTATAATLFYLAAGSAPPLTSALTGLTVSKWILKSNGTTVLAIPSIGGASSVYSTTNGTSWTSSALPIGSLTPLDLAWSEALQLWLLSTNASQFYTSPDGVTWTSTGPSPTLTTGIAWAVAASGRGWAAAFIASGTSLVRIIYSDDAVRWYGTNTYLNPGGTFVRPALAHSRSQLCAYFPTATSTPAFPFRFSFEGDNPSSAIA